MFKLIQLTYQVPTYSFSEIIDKLFDVCCAIIYYIGNITGSGFEGYQIVNLIIFMFLQPALILLFFILWRTEKSRSKTYKEAYTALKNKLHKYVFSP